jgi:hypothetical protein
VCAVFTNIGRNHISLRDFIHCLPSPLIFSLQQSSSCHWPSMSLNGKNNNIYHIHIKSCVLHAKSHVSLPSYYGSTCQKMTPVIPRGLTPATQEHYLQSYILQCQQKKCQSPMEWIQCWEKWHGWRTGTRNVSPKCNQQVTSKQQTRFSLTSIN